MLHQCANSNINNDPTADGPSTRSTRRDVKDDSALDMRQADARLKNEFFIQTVAQR